MYRKTDIDFCVFQTPIVIHNDIYSVMLELLVRNLDIFDFLYRISQDWSNVIMLNVFRMAIWDTL